MLYHLKHWVTCPPCVAIEHVKFAWVWALTCLDLSDCFALMLSILFIFRKGQWLTGKRMAYFGAMFLLVCIMVNWCYMWLPYQCITWHAGDQAVLPSAALWFGLWEWCIAYTRACKCTGSLHHWMLVCGISDWLQCLLGWIAYSDALCIGFCYLQVGRIAYFQALWHTGRLHGLMAVRMTVWWTALSTRLCGLLTSWMAYCLVAWPNGRLRRVPVVCVV